VIIRLVELREEIKNFLVEKIDYAKFLRDEKFILKLLKYSIQDQIQPFMKTFLL